MWKLNEPPKVRRATHALCSEFKDMEAAPGDRMLDDRRVTRHKASVSKGRFRPCVWARVFCKETGKTYRVNGKHTSTMMSELNGELKNQFVIIEDYEADTLLDMADLYATFDSRDTLRTTGDINKSFSHAIHAISEVDSATVNLSVTAIAICTWGFSYSPVRAEERAALLEANQDFVLWMNDMLHGIPNVDRKTIKRSPVAAAMFKTWARDRKASQEFWVLVRDGSGPKHTSPDRKLNKFLLSACVASPNGSSASVRCTQREMHVKCLHAWNAWRRNAATDLKVHATAAIPKAI